MKKAESGKALSISVKKTVHSPSYSNMRAFRKENGGFYLVLSFISIL